MRWNKRAKVERPEYPKLVPLPAGVDAEGLLSDLRTSDPEAEIVKAGERGSFARVHNKEAEAIARPRGESRSFPLA